MSERSVVMYLGKINNMVLHKITKTRSSFPIDDAESELLYLALNNIS